MIFATIGTQLPFNRLICQLDQWAQCHPAVEIYAQIGRGGTKPAHMKWSESLQSVEFRTYMEACDIVVSHAGMGTIITAIEMRKRVIVMPRRADLGEHRNDHQLATVSHLMHLQLLEIVHDRNDLEKALSLPRLVKEPLSESQSSSALISEIRQFVDLKTL